MTNSCIPRRWRKQRDGVNTLCLLPFASRCLSGSLLLLTYCLLSGCNKRDPKFQQYFVEGEQLYLKHCSNCHQSTGKGLWLVYPPLAPSDFMDNKFEEVICMIKYGREGEVVVNGNSYSQRMPGVPTLTELEIAEITTYVYNCWGHERGMVDVRDIGPVIRKCKDGHSQGPGR